MTPADARAQVAPYGWNIDDDGRLVRWIGLSSKCATGWMTWGLYRTELLHRVIDNGPPMRVECRAVWVWEDDPAPSAETVFADPEAESTIATQPTDLWRNNTTE